MIRYREGDLITLAKEGHFDVITHGCNCFCTMGAGIAPKMAAAFGCDKFTMEAPEYKGDINKLGTIDYEYFTDTGTYLRKSNPNDLYVDDVSLIVVNSYTQYRYGRNHADGDKTPVDYDAIRLCMRKINHIFKGKTIGLPKIGAGLAGGDWSKISKILVEELNSMDIWVINYNK
jgi:O-acetyl-ADP-ribose deacetylase (regulator of RNase III)